MQALSCPEIAIDLCGTSNTCSLALCRAIKEAGNPEFEIQSSEFLNISTTTNKHLARMPAVRDDSDLVSLACQNMPVKDCNRLDTSTPPDSGSDFSSISSSGSSSGSGSYSGYSSGSTSSSGSGSRSSSSSSSGPSSSASPSTISSTVYKARNPVKPAGPIAGGVIGGVLFVLILIGFALYYRKRRGTKMPQEVQTETKHPSGEA